MYRNKFKTMIILNFVKKKKYADKRNVKKKKKNRDKVGRTRNKNNDTVKDTEHVTRILWNAQNNCPLSVAVGANARPRILQDSSSFLLSWVFVTKWAHRRT